MFPPFRGHDRGIISVAFSPDGSKIISESYDNTIRVWNAITGVEVPCAQTEVDDIRVSRSAMNGAFISLKGGWFTDINTGNCLGRLLVGASFYRWKANRSIYVGWTLDHKLVIVRLLTQKMY